MLIYEKYVEEDSELVKHLFGTMNNVPGENDNKLVYKDYDGNVVEGLSLDYKYVDYDKGGILVIREDDNLPIKVFIETSGGDLIQIIPASGNDYYVVAPEQTLVVTNSNPEPTIEPYTTYDVPDVLPNTYSVTVDRNKLEYDSNEEAYVYEDTETGDTYSVQLRSAPKRLTLKVVSSNDEPVVGDYTVDILDKKPQEMSNLVDSAIVDIAQAG